MTFEIIADLIKSHPDYAALDNVHQEIATSPAYVRWVQNYTRLLNKYGETIYSILGEHRTIPEPFKPIYRDVIEKLQEQLTETEN